MSLSYDTARCLGEDDRGTCPHRNGCLRYTATNYGMHTAFASRLCDDDEMLIAPRSNNVVVLKRVGDQDEV